LVTRRSVWVDIPGIEQVRAAIRDELPLSATPSGALGIGAATAGEGSVCNGEWVEQSRDMTFTFAGIFLGSVRFRCITLLRPLHQLPYRLSLSLLDQLPEGVHALHISQAISTKLPRVSLFKRGIYYVPLQGRRFFIDLSGPFEAYLGKFKTKKRSEIRRQIRRFTQARNCCLREYRDGKDITEFHSLAREVSRKTYQHRLLCAGIEASPSSFREQIVRNGTSCRWRGYILFRQQMPIAYNFCQERCGDLVGCSMGFDPSFAADRPGALLFWLVLQRLFAGGEFRRLDLGEGEYPFKEHLATGGVDVAEIYYFPWNFRNCGFVALHSTLAAATNLLNFTLEIFGIGQRLKKMIRQVSACSGAIVVSSAPP
jgi:Acetyltransferase (GNAT) domain